MAYLLFAGNDYYHSGGAEDLIGKFDTVEAAIAAHNPNDDEYKSGLGQVLCLDSLKVVKRFYLGNWTNPN